MPSTLTDELAAGIGRRIQPTFGYYRQPNGWITISPNTRLERLKYTEEGWEYLDKYGSFDMTAYTANHPFEGLFMFGGVEEMPVEQVLATGLYFDPPLIPTCHEHLTQFHRAHRQDCWKGARPISFPQLEGVPAEKLGPFQCDFCDRQLATAEGLAQHHSVAHVLPSRNIQLGKTLGESIAQAMRPPAAETDELIELRKEVARLKKGTKSA